MEELSGSYSPQLCYGPSNPSHHSWPKPAAELQSVNTRNHYIAATQPAPGAYRLAQLDALTAAHRKHLLKI